jgi:hypothetical protein
MRYSVAAIAFIAFVTVRQANSKLFCQKNLGRNL